MVGQPATFAGEAFPRSYGLGGATITFKTGEGDTILTPTQTKADGSYSVTGSIIPFQVPALARPIQVDNVIAHYAGDSNHMPAEATAHLKS